MEYPCLVMIAGLEEGTTYPLVEGETILGRGGDDLGIPLTDTSVSRRHARIQLKDDKFTIRDLGSRNETRVNGRKLGTGEEKTLEHGDEIRAGIYVFRLALKPLDPEPEVFLEPSPKEQLPISQSTTVSDEEPEITHRELNPVSEPELEIPVLAIDQEPPREKTQLPVQKSTKPRRQFFLALLVFLLLVATLFALYQYQDVLFLKETTVNDSFEEVSKVEKVETVEEELAEIVAEEQSNQEIMAIPAVPSEIITESPPEKPMSPTIEETPPVPVPVGLPASNATGREFHAFLDVKSQPLPARIYFDDLSLGVTPLKTGVTLLPDSTHTVTAEFDLKDIRDRYQQKQEFKADVRKDVFSIDFVADIGMIRILKLPRNIEFYMEGFYAYDKYKSNPVKISNIIYGQPIYVPFGHYVVELREKVRVGEADNFVSETRYHREFDLNADRRDIEITVQDKDLQFFPAKILSTPSGAQVYLDNEKLGVTPFTGDLPLGAHELKLTRDGYFDSVTKVDLKANSPYEQNIKLETSKSGQLINRARDHRRAGRYQQALNDLVEALKSGASGREKAEIHLLLGDSYFLLKDYSQAEVYFGQAKSDPEYYTSAVMGIARVQSVKGNRHQSLLSIVEVLIKAPEGGPLSKEARALFAQVAGMQSVVYVASEPEGATVLVNNQEISQKTPLVLTDMSIGSLRLEVRKTGFQTEQIKKSLTVSEFVPILVKLKPEQF